MYYPDSVAPLHKKILKGTRLHHIWFHDLRHAFPTTALQNGVDLKPVSSMLGHYPLRTTSQKQNEVGQTMGPS